jgi:phosphate transport system ATP-binding protein
LETLIDELRENYTVAIVTHAMPQAARVSERTACFHPGKRIEVGESDRTSFAPRRKLTETT